MIQNADKLTGIDAMRRWKRGHQAFFVLVQGLIIAHVRLRRAFAENRLDEARRAMVDATELLWGATAAFRFAGDITVEDYTNIVRPSMIPPYVSDGFSGLYSADHAYLIKVLQSLKPIFKHLPADLKQQHRTYRMALNAVYEGHAYVCDRFVGERGSLKNVDVSGPEFIRTHLKRRTLLLAGCPIPNKFEAS